MKNLLYISLVLLQALLLPSCKKDSKNNNPSNYTYYFHANINGTATVWNVPNSGSPAYVEGSGGSLISDQGVVTGGLTALISAITSYQPQIGIQFRTFNV